MPSFAFGGASRERVVVEVHGYERAPVGEFYDDNWVRASVSVAVGAFSGQYDAALLTVEFAAFRTKLQALYESLKGTACFSSLEGQITLDLAGDGLGHIGLEGVAVDAAGTGNRLEFKMELDQSDLPAVLQGLDEILISYPPRAG